ncbi:hypothetical protein FF38_01660 [Lucilia cuprina]|uniref:DUF4794 domain-containing protein n=1 Tax=Lucilia cuprina TaxID=7375 RepID=A0A0L0BRI8_LUCCU|nr:hypothetical protein FF38_01660 [Lucilia cuprina]
MNLRKFLIVALAFVACAYADVSELGYDYQQPAAPAPAPVEPERSYIPPAAPAPAPAPVNTYVPPPQPQPTPAPVNTYVPPAPVAPHVEEPVNAYIPPAPVAPEQPLAPVEEIEQTPEDGYRYKTVRRVVYRNRA